jgi:hypothetical protein
MVCLIFLYFYLKYNFELFFLNFLNFNYFFSRLNKILQKKIKTTNFARDGKQTRGTSTSKA